MRAAEDQVGKDTDEETLVQKAGGGRAGQKWKATLGTPFPIGVSAAECCRVTCCLTGAAALGWSPSSALLSVWKGDRAFNRASFLWLDRGLRAGVVGTYHHHVVCVLPAT